MHPQRSARRARRFYWLGALLLTPATLPHFAEARAPEKELAGRLAAYFETSDLEARRAEAAAAEQDPAFRPERLPALLHGLPLWPELAPGRSEIEIPVGFGQVRRVTLRIPKDYTPEKAWPLLLCYHPSGTNGPNILSYVQSLLGHDVERYVLAAPTDFRQTRLDAPPPFTAEHPALLREVQKQVHVDSDRVFAMGVSMGGHAAWMFALFHPDLLAGALPMASTISIPGDFPAAWESVTPNLAGLPLLHVWGAEDPLDQPGLEGRNPNVGTMASLNQAFSPLIEKLGLAKLKENRLKGVGHNGTAPKPGELERLLKSRRERWPKKVSHRFRHLHQASAYWLEALEWQGEGWFDFQRPLERAEGETWPQAYERVFLPLLGELRGEVLGQKIRIETRHVADLVVWLSPELIDLGQPIEIDLNGKPVFAGKVTPSLAVALAQAEVTRDFERLRWAGVRIDAAGNATVVDGATVFPPLIRQP